MMTVKDLKAMLNGLDEDALVSIELVMPSEKHLIKTIDFQAYPDYAGRSSLIIKMKRD